MLRYEKLNGCIGEESEQTFFFFFILSGFFLFVLVCLFQKLSPALLKELPHVMTSSTNVWIVFIEFFTVIKDQVDIDDERLQVLIPEI